MIKSSLRSRLEVLLYELDACLKMDSLDRDFYSAFWSVLFYFWSYRVRSND